MSDFPNNFDFVIYGTGIVESILSAALSTTGNNVLHLDKNEYYGGYNGCLRLVELEKLIENWNLENAENNNIFTEVDDYVRNIFCKWNVKAENIDNSVIENGEPESTEIIWTEQTLRHSIRSFEFELFPRILFSESKIIDALIQSDVTRYLEFKFITKFATFSDNKIIQIPINRSDIVKTKVFSLRQKRQLTSFLEWCFTVNINDDIITKYVGRPLFELIRTEKNVDIFTEKIIIECMALSPGNVETKEGILKIKRLLQSFNKYGPYPIMWPNYGCGEISQAFCRMSAVFGSVYSLNTSIVSCSSQLSENGQLETTQTDEGQVPVQHRKIKLTLSNNSEVYTDKIIAPKSYVNPNFLINKEHMGWVSRAILVTNRSLLEESRDPNDILMFPFHLGQIETPAILLEFPDNSNHRNATKNSLFIVHLTCFTETVFDSKELFEAYFEKIFERYDPDSDLVTVTKPQVLYECYFTLPDLSNTSVDLSGESSNVADHLVFVTSPSSNIEFDECVKEASDLFACLLPSVEFLPRPPNPEDVIQLGEETISSINQTSGDFPFETNFAPSNAQVLGSPGDGLTTAAGISDAGYQEIDESVLVELLVEAELNVESEQ